jgi:cysteinyl-tRNA synthetase
LERRLYETLTREKRPVVPIDPARVRMYECGPTVYDFAHIGNARPVIVFDALFRLLRHIYGDSHVTYVRNVTDVDDKINARAAERGISIRDLTEETYKNFRQDVAALGCLEPTAEPRATEYVSKPDAPTDMIRLIAQLVKNGCAYVAEGHVLFHVAAMKDYGKLSNRSLVGMVAGARVEVAPYKKDPMDFVLWKPSPPELPGWESPWGRGRPGWHIECSAMSAALLGETFDIHGGGIDLVFPHHENEIAQSRCAFHTPVMANYWMHNGFLQVEGKKMAKSAGNFVTITDLLSTTAFGRHRWPGEVLRLAMLRTQYRQPIDWTVKGLVESWKTLDQWQLATDSISEDIDQIVDPDSEFIDALADDLNTPMAIARLHSLHGEIKWSASGSSNLNLQKKLKASAKFIGLMKSPAKVWLTQARESAGVDGSKVQALIDARAEARRTKNFAESDRIRDELATMGVVLKDSKDGTTWEVAR